MGIPLLDLSDQYRLLAEPIREAIDEVLASQRFILGAKVREFEEAIAKYCGSPHSVGVSSGTDAQLAILTALGFGPGDAILTTAYTFLRRGDASREWERRRSLSISIPGPTIFRRPPWSVI